MRRLLEILSPALRRPVVRFLLIGVISTLAYAGLYLALRGDLGADGANALALALTAVANTQANRHFTFGLRGRRGLLRQHAAGALVYLLALAITAGALSGLEAADRHPAHMLELTVLILASAVATLTRYVALRTWVFSRARVRAHAGGGGPTRPPTSAAAT
ncbi:MAG: GtrA family protein [Solirubrobacteraceae bacterium]